MVLGWFPGGDGDRGRYIRMMKVSVTGKKVKQGKVKEDETWYSKKKNWVYKHRENELDEIKLRDKQDKIKKGFWYEAKVFGTHSILNGSARDH